MFVSLDIVYQFISGSFNTFGNLSIFMLIPVFKTKSYILFIKLLFHGFHKGYELM